MMATKETIYTKDPSNKKLTVVREFDAPVEKVWNAWTKPELLDQWWGPKPWNARTVSMDFREGGRWFYYMEGPEGERHYCIAEYKTIVPNKSYTCSDAFTDEKGNKKNDMFMSTWNVVFSKSGSGTKVSIDITGSEEDIKNMVEMGFKEGFSMGHNQLDELLANS